MLVSAWAWAWAPLLRCVPASGAASGRMAPARRSAPSQMWFPWQVGGVLLLLLAASRRSSLLEERCLSLFNRRLHETFKSFSCVC